jgi:hypothetical protein
LISRDVKKKEIQHALAIKLIRASILSTGMSISFICSDHDEIGMLFRSVSRDGINPVKS